uniref:SGNH hydrolase-type esterase domain-containing protein n=1 Tax=Magallana gigas TaxID=29159 RepID=A0A8W8J6G5_MAGGI
MNRLLMSSLASNTTKAYTVGLQAFDQFRLNQQLSILWPPPSNHILMFIAHLSIQGCKQTTARAYTSAIAFKCKVLGNGDPTKHFLVGLGQLPCWHSRAYQNKPYKPLGDGIHKPIGLTLDPVNVWILGSSIIKHATVAASQRIGGTNLSIPNANIWWQGYSGMKLLDLVPKLKYLKGLKLQSPPHIIVVHCGANNVGKTRLDRLLTMVHDILSQCKTLFPKTKFVWSSTLPRITWRYSTNTRAMNQTRTRVDRQAIKTMVSLGGAYIKHPKIKISHTQLFHSDGTHLSKLGNDLFLNNLQGAIEHIMGVKTK